MRRVQAGDEPALAALMERWELPVKRLLARIVLNHRDAEELAQETFVRVWTQRARYRPEAEFRPWCFSIAVNLARNRLRWWRRRPTLSLDAWMTDAPGHEPAADQPTQAAALERTERAATVQHAVAALPVELREALVLFAFEQLPHAEIAATLGCTVKAVETRIYRARALLRKSLANLA